MTVNPAIGEALGARDLDRLRASAEALDLDDVLVPSARGPLPFLEAALRTGDAAFVAGVLGLPNLHPARALPAHGFWAWARDVDPDVVRAFLERSGVPPGHADANGRTLLLELAAGDRPVDAGLAAELVAAGPVDHRAADGTTPFFHAAIHGHLDLFDALLAAGADPDAENAATGWTALVTAVALGRHDVVGHLVAIRDLDVNHADREGMAALHHAARLGATASARALLGRPDIGVNRVDAGRRTPLHHAVSVGALPVVELLLAHPGVNLAVTDRPERRSPWELADYLGLAQAARLVAAREAELGPQDDTPSNDPPPRPAPADLGDPDATASIADPLRRP